MVGEESVFQHSAEVDRQAVPGLSGGGALAERSNVPLVWGDAAVPRCPQAGYPEQGGVTIQMPLVPATVLGDGRNDLRAVEGAAEEVVRRDIPDVRVQARDRRAANSGTEQGHVQDRVAYVPESA